MKNGRKPARRLPCLLTGFPKFRTQTAQARWPGIDFNTDASSKFVIHVIFDYAGRENSPDMKHASHETAIVITGSLD